MSANEKQVGGDHYRTPIQHWDYVLANDIPYLEAQIIKYLTRWRKKGGLTDVMKARHFLDKLIEVETAKASAGRDKSYVIGEAELNSAVFDRVRERATAERELENDNAAGDELETARTPNWP